MEVKVASWNMGYWQHRAQHENAWRYLIEKIQPAIALVQEAVVPEWVEEAYKVVSIPAYDKYQWGSAVISKYQTEDSIDITQLEPKLSDHILGYKGQIVGVKLSVGCESFAVISVHAPAVTVPMRDIPSDMHEVIKLNLNSYIWRADVLYGALRHLPQNVDRFIVGGDWNTSRLFDEKYGPRGNQEFFDRMESAGLRECFRRVHPSEIQTWYRDGDAGYQLDHFFCDARTYEQLEYCEVDPTPALDGLSDHAPIKMKIK